MNKQPTQATFDQTGEPLPPEKTNGVRPMICTPMYGGMAATNYIQSMVATLLALGKHGIYPRLHTMSNESLITRARNNCLAVFLHSDCTHLFFVDSDVGWNPQSMVDILSSGLDVAFGAYPKKETNWPQVFDRIKNGFAKTWQEAAEAQASWAINFKEDHASQGAFPCIERNGNLFIEVKEASTGFCCISRECIEKMLEVYGSEIKYKSDTNGAIEEERYALFDCAPICEGESDLKLVHMKQAARALVANPSSETTDKLLQAATTWVDANPSGKGRYLSEDYLFSRRWESLGGKIYVMANCNLTHAGFAIFHGAFGKMFQKVPAGSPVAPKKKLSKAP